MEWWAFTIAAGVVVAGLVVWGFVGAGPPPYDEADNYPD